jgi:glutamine synthetase
MMTIRTGGNWLAWGTQNFSTPLRRLSLAGHWSINCIDGLANPYFALSAIIAAGLLGLAANEQEFREKDLHLNPSTLDDQSRAGYGVTRKMPAIIGEAMEELGRDGALNEALAPGLVHDYLRMKEVELEMLCKMSAGERRVFLMERY